MSRRVLGSACLIMLIGCDDTASTPTTPTATPPSASVDRANAADDYIAALMIVKSKTKYVERDLSRAVSEGLDGAPHGVLVSLKQCAPAMQRLVAAAKRSRCEWPEIDLLVKIRRFGLSALYLVDVALLSAEQELEAGRHVEAADIFDGLVRYVVRVQGEEEASPFSYRTVIHNWVFRRLSEPEFPTAFWNRVTRTLEWAEPRGFLTARIKAELQRLLTGFERNPPKPEDALSPGDNLPPEMLKWSVDSDRLKARLCKPYEEWIRRSRLLYSEVQALPAVEVPRKEDFYRRTKEFMSRVKERTLPPPEEGTRIISDLLADLLLVIGAPAHEKSHLLAALDLSDMRGALILIALRTHFANSGSFPSDLSDVPSAWTVDPFSGEPFVYRKEAGGIVLYSVGQNLKDDGGDEGRVRRGLDIVYRLKNR